MPGFRPIGSFPIASNPSSGQSPAAGYAIFSGSNVLSNQLQLTVGHLLFTGPRPAAVLKAPRVSWVGQEVLHGGAADPRISWIGLEVLRTTSTHPTQSVVTWVG